MADMKTLTINGTKYTVHDETARSAAAAAQSTANGKANASHKHTKSEITDFPTSMPASDVSAWAKAATKPTYTASEVGADASGTAASAVSAHNNDPYAHADIRNGISNAVEMANSASANASYAIDVANSASSNANYAVSVAEGKAPMYSYGTADLTAGTSTLETGKLYFVYE